MTKFSAIMPSKLSHNAPCLPSKICISIVFVSWKNCNTQEKSQTKVMENFRGQTRCLMADVQIANPKT